MKKKIINYCDVKLGNRGLLKKIEKNWEKYSNSTMKMIKKGWKDWI